MQKLRTVIKFFIDQYPKMVDMPKRLTLLVFLADWRSVLTRGVPITNLRWVYDYLGFEPEGDGGLLASFYPRPDQRPSESLEKIESFVRLHGGEYHGLSNLEKDVLRHVIETTHDLSFNELLHLTRSTLPVITAEPNKKMDLKKSAALHRELFYSHSPKKNDSSNETNISQKKPSSLNNLCSNIA